MRGALIGFLTTAGLWVALILAFVGIELFRGHAPFAMFVWEPGGKFVTFTMLLVLALGTGVGLASDRIRSRSGQ